MHNASREFYIKLFIVTVMVLAGIMWANHLTASVNKEINYNYADNVINNSPATPDWQTFIIQSEIKQVRQRSYKASGNACNCVKWVQANGLGITGYGAAKNYPITSKTPGTQGFVITYEGPLGHIGKYRLDGEWLIIDEANYLDCMITYGRRLHTSSLLIKGYL